MASPEEQTPLASGCNRCLLDAFVPPAYPEPKTELMTEAQDLPRDLCTGLRLSPYNSPYIGHSLYRARN